MSVFWAVLRRGAGTLALLSVAGLLLGQLTGRGHWFFELFSHFVPHYALAFLLAAGLLSGVWRVGYGLLALVLAAWLVQPWALWQGGGEGTSASRSVLWYNVHLGNAHAREESAWMLDAAPEVLALAEIDFADPGWQGLLEAYPHGCEHREASPFALALRSRAPLLACEVHFVDGFPFIRALTADGAALYALHPPPPIVGELARARSVYLQVVARRMATEARVLAVGDLNSSPFSPLFRDLLRESGAAALTPYWMPTWKPFFLNIDHALQRGLAARAQALPWRFSDHRPLQVWF
ncbi:MAG: endonuclease/exonuclease/phosphatase family protein [Cardiobacteriaceae bacterium]|nr:endonuclease/exonuclease/phosphatase family protein [Cardiobacteriaceae bacterium]